MAEETTDTAIETTTTRSVFITDGISPVARAVNRRLTAAGHRVTALTGNSDGAKMIREDGGLPVFVDPTRQGELTGMLKMAEVDLVVHLAPLAANETPVFPADGVTADDLVDGTRALLDAAKEIGVEYVVFVSTAALYGTTSEPVDEDAPTVESDDPLLAATRRCEAIVRDSGLTSAILRAGYLYGAESDVMRRADARLRAGRPVHMSDALAPWVRIEDLADAIMRTVSQRPEDVVLTIVDDQPASSKEVFTYLATAQGMEPPGAVAGLLKLFSRPKTSARLALSTQASNARAKDVLGWSPGMPDIHQGIDDMLLTWRAKTS
jgi:nucleoside-diphosphate-sugar epimerase